MTDPTTEQFAGYELVREIQRRPNGVDHEAVSAEGAMVTLVTQDSGGGEPAPAFEREATALEGISHPNLVGVVDHGAVGERLFLVEEPTAGLRLDELLNERRLSLPEALRVFKDLLMGLSAAHSQGVVHRLLEPSQICVTEDLSVVKLRGFCLGLPDSRSEGTVATSRGMFGGLHYLAPEQARNPQSINAQCNVYSLGVVFYELLTGRVPRGRFNLPSQLNPEVPSELDALVMKCVAEEPSRRFASLDQVRTRFLAVEDQLRLGLVHELQGIQRSTAKMFRGQKPESGRRWLIWGAIASLLALAAVVAALLAGLPG